MRTIPAPELALWLGTGAREYRVRVRRPGETEWTNLSDALGGDWVLAIRADGDTPDQPAGRFDLTFLKHATEGSASPGISESALNVDAALEFRPLLHPGRSVEVDARVDASPWRLWLQGEIEDVAWPGGEVVCTCLTLDAVLTATQIEVEEQRGAEDPGTPLATEIQGLLDRWLADPPTLVTVGDPAANLGVYVPSLGSLGEQVRSHAQRIAWDVRYRWNEAAGDFRLTLSLPPRDKTEADLELPASQVFAVPGLEQSRQYVRNAVRVPYLDADGAAQVEVATDDDSIAEYRRQAMVLDERGEESPIRSQAQAAALADYAISDLAQPLIDGRFEIPFLPWIELHDLVAIEADGDHFDYDTTFAVVGVSHRVDPEQGAWTEIAVRGGAPAGQFYSWHNRPPPVLRAAAYELDNFREVPASAPGKRRWEWDARGALVDSVWWAYDVFPVPWADDNWTEVAEAVVPLDDAQNWVEVDEPGADEVGALQVEPRLLDGTIYGADVVERVQVYPVPPKTAGDIDARMDTDGVDLYVTAQPTTSALPVAWEVREGTKTGTLLASGEFTTLAAAATGVGPSTPALNDRALPPEGKQTWWAKFTDRAGNVEWVNDSVGAPRLPMFSGVRTVPSSDLLSVDIYGVLEDPYPVGGTLRYWLPADPETPADPSGAPTGTLAVAAGDLPLSFGPGTIAAFDDFTVAGSSFALFLEFEATDGRTTGAQKFTLDASLGFLVDALGQLRAGSVHNGLVLAQEFRPYFLADDLAQLATLTPDDIGTDLGFAVDTLTPYLWDGDSWEVQAGVPAVGFAPILRSGVVTAEVIATGALQAKLVGAERLTADNIIVQFGLEAGEYLQSLNFVAGVSGWRIDEDGAEFNNGTFRGTLDGVLGTFDAITGTSIEIDGGYLTLMNGAYLVVDGDATIGGNLSADGNATIGGTLSFNPTWSLGVGALSGYAIVTINGIQRKIPYYEMS